MIWLLAPAALFALAFLPGCERKQDSSEPKSSALPKTEPQGDAYSGPSQYLNPIAFNGRNIVPTSNGILRTRVEMEGDPSLGTVFFLRNYHTPGFGMMRQDDRQDYQLFIIASQWKTLQLLEQLGAKDVFYERVSKTTTGEDFLNQLRGNPRMSPVLPVIDALKVEHSDYPPYGIGLLNVDLGAPYTYAIRNPEVRLQPVFTPEEHKETLRMRVADGSQNTLDREAWATREISQFLKANPGKSVVLVFGAAHNFCDNFAQQNFKPRMVSAWFEFPEKVQLWKDTPPSKFSPDWNVNSNELPLPKCP